MKIFSYFPSYFWCVLICDLSALSYLHVIFFTLKWSFTVSVSPYHVGIYHLVGIRTFFLQSRVGVVVSVSVLVTFLLCFSLWFVVYFYSIFWWVLYFSVEYFMQLDEYFTYILFFTLLCFVGGTIWCLILLHLLFCLA